MTPASSGALYVVATPIGNLKDITQRALEILSSVDLILAEDTRQTAKLLSHYKIQTPSTSFHDYTAGKKQDSIIQKLKDGKNLALVSDSGTPLVSDPGFPLLRDAVEAGITIIPIPGASAVLAAIVASGAPMERFVFEGFLPPKGSPRRERLAKIGEEESTIVLYESPYHLIKLLEDLSTILGANRKIVIGRELTKIHEEFLRGTVAEMLETFKNKKIQGEFVIIVPKKDKTERLEELESQSEI